jgi:hypothetical protein
MAVVLVLMIAFAMVGGSQKVHADEGCTNGSREQAKSFAAAGDLWNPVPTVELAGQYGGASTHVDTVAKIELRSAMSVNCSWALISNANTFYSVWIDRSYNDGANWEGPLSQRAVNIGADSTYTGVYDNTGPRRLRACVSNGEGGVACTFWN